jgi:hypothetical protein
MRSPSAAAFSRIAISSALLTVRSFFVEIDEGNLGQALLQARVHAVRHPAVGIERAGKPVDADLGAGKPEFGEPVGDAVAERAALGPHVGDPALGAAPVVGEDRRIDE